jgi:hypothetical protein
VTSKLQRALVGVGMALGGAAPACLGRTAVAGDFPSPGEPDGVTEPTLADSGSDASDASDVTDASDATDASDGAAMDAASDALIDPFCDVSWPPTKGNEFSGPVACVDPLRECSNEPLPYRCIRLLEPYVCDLTETRVGPLYCIGGAWRCPPGTDDGARCVCYGPLPPGKTCTDAGLM